MWLSPKETFFTKIVSGLNLAHRHLSTSGLEDLHGFDFSIAAKVELYTKTYYLSSIHSSIIYWYHDNEEVPIMAGINLAEKIKDIRDQALGGRLLRNY